MKMVLLAIISVLLMVSAGAFYTQSQKQQRQNDAMLSLHLQMQGIGPVTSNQPIVRVILTTGDCGENADLTGESFTGFTARKYCDTAGIGDFHPRLETSCLREGLRQRNDAINGYGSSFTPTKADYVTLACGIANSYPDTTESWEDDSLTDGLRTLINDYLSTKN